MTEILQGLTSLFGAVALLAIVAGGFVLMFSPKHGKKILKNVAIAVAIFVIASILASTVATAAKDAVRRASFRDAIVNVAWCALAVAALGAGFLYIFQPKLAQALLRHVAVVAVIIILFPVLAAILLGRIGIAGGFLALGVASTVAFFIRESRRPRPERRRKPGAAERTPLLPHGRVRR